MSETTRNHWLSLLAQTREAFNACANMVASAKTPLSLVAVHAQCYDVLRKQFPQIPSQGIIRVQKSVLAMLRSIRGNKHKNASVPQMKSLALQLDKRLYSNLSINGISLSNGKPQKREKCTFVLYDKVCELFSTCVPKDPTIFARDGRLFLSVPFEVQSLPCKDDTAIGVDLGIKDYAILSDGTKFANPKHLEKAQRNLAHLQKVFARKDKDSKNYERMRIKVAKCHRSITNQRNDFLHKLSTHLVSNYDVICLEDLNVKGMEQNHHLARAIQGASWSEFVRQLEYKSEWYGKNVLFIGRFEPSSKLCHKCGYINKDLKLTDRSWICPVCGEHLDRDVNAAINIKNIAFDKQNLVGV